MMTGGWFGTWISFFHSAGKNPNCRTHTFPRGRYTTNQMKYAMERPRKSFLKGREIAWNREHLILFGQCCHWELKMSMVKVVIKMTFPILSHQVRNSPSPILLMVSGLGLNLQWDSLGWSFAAMLDGRSYVNFQAKPLPICWPNVSQISLDFG